MGANSSLEEGVPEGITEDPTTCFKVRNDVTIGESSSCQISQKGTIAITDSELKLYQKHSTNPIIWPFKCLRRYGFGNDTFFFESGRRCETGPSLFAFKSKQYEQMARVFNDKIQAFNRAEMRRRNGTLLPTWMDQKRMPDSVRYSQRNDHVINPMVSEEQYLVPVSGKQAPVPSQQYVNGDVLQSNGQQNYVNTQQPVNPDYTNASAFDTATGGQPMPLPSLNPPSDPRLNYAQLDLPPNLGDDGDPISGLTCFILNQYSDDDDDAFLPTSPSSAPYVNLPTMKSPNGSVANAISSMPGSRDSQSRLNQSLSGSFSNGMRSVMYSEASSLALPTDTPTNGPSAQYTQIDFQKTKALASTTKQSSCDSQEGVRKTRHDSAADTLQ